MSAATSTLRPFRPVLLPIARPGVVTIALLAFAALVVVACGGEDRNAAESSDSTPPPTAVASSPTATSDPNECGYSQGRNTSAQVAGRTVLVHLPLCYDTTSDRYPVVILIHGAGADETQWPDVGATSVADRLIKDGSIAPIILVMPAVGESTGDEQDAFVANQLVPFIDGKFRTLPDAAHRAVGGISRGGGAALRTGSEHPELFSVVGGHSPATGGDTAVLVEGLRANSGRIWLDVGSGDSLVTTTTSLARRLASDGTDVEFEVNPGRHDRDYWRAHMSEYLIFYAARWR